jgi:O-antigen/teichoic acid export membrane protein
MFSGYVFWLILSKIATPEIIGTSSAVISLATIFTTIVSIGVPSGVQRFLGKCFSEQKLEETKVSVKASLILVSLGVLTCSTLILISKEWIYDVFKIGFSLIVVFILLIASSAISNLFRSIVIASVKTKILPAVAILSTIAKFALTIILVVIGTGALGITIGFTFFPILTSVLLTITTIGMIFKSSKDKSETSFSHYFKNILVASMVVWIPSLITTTGSQLGTIVVLGIQGASQAGIYFIAFSIVMGISTLMSVLSSIAYPTLSAMHDGRKRFTWRITKLGLIFTLPFSSSIIFYTKEVMQLFGRGYIEGSFTLQILLLSILPMIVMSGINILVYSYGNYRQVLAIGLAGSIPRTIFYFIFVPIYGDIGAAISYTIGSIFGFILSTVIAKKIGMHIFWKDLTLIMIIPIGIAFILSLFGTNYIISILITLVICYTLLLKLQIVTRPDLQDALSVMPKKIANPILNLVAIFAKKLNRSF